MRRFINDLKKYKDYINYQAKAQLKNEITGSYLGWIWLVLEPLCFMLIYTFIAGVVFERNLPYLPVFIFSGLAFWNFFKNTLTTSVKLIVKNKDIVTKVYVPKFVLLVVVMLVNLFKLLVQFGLLVIFMICYHVPITWNVLWVIPIVISLITFTFGLSSIFLHVGVFVEDLVNITNLGLRFMFYLTGIFYDIMKRVPAPYNHYLAKVNPMAYFITSFRNAIIYSSTIQYIYLIFWFLVGVLLSIVGVRVIYKYENTYVKVMKG